MLLSIFVRITNTMSSFSLVYTFISFESAQTFKFVNICYNKLFLKDDCPRPEIILDDFSFDLSAIMVEKTGMIVVKTEMTQAYELVNHLNALGK